MQCLQPVDPDAQKHQILEKYDTDLQRAIKLYSLDMQQKSNHLLKHVIRIFYEIFDSVGDLDCLTMSSERSATLFITLLFARLIR